MIDYNAITNKQGLIVYGGESSTDFGMVVGRAPAFDKPIKRTEAYTVPGKNGAVIFQNGSYDDVTRTYTIWVAEDETPDSGGVIHDTLAERVSALTAWLYSQNGYTRLEDNFEPDVFRLAYYSGANNVSNELTQYGESELTFTCRPERFYKDAETPIAISHGDTMTNPTRFSSKPLIKIEAAGTVEVSINGVAITAVVTDYIYIDVERMNAYRLASENKNDKISGAFPVLAPGVNTIGITVTGTLTGVSITPRYFTI